jgi:hypothetical protein
MARISDDDLNQLKRNLSLAELCRSRGIELKRHGRKDLIGKCLFHEDDTPSFVVSPDKNLFHCMGCDAAGSVVDFVMKADALDFKAAVEKLMASSGTLHRASDPATRNPEPVTLHSSLSPEREAQLLERVVALYTKGFAEAPEGRAYLESRGITDAGLFSRHRVGYANGRLLDLLPKDGQLKEELKALGVLLASGEERFKECVVFPVFDADGRLVTLYGRQSEMGDLKSQIAEMSAEHRAEAEAFGKSPALIEEIVGDCVKRGLIGERNNVILLYVAMTSRKRETPLSVLILSSSGSGKTALQDAVLAFCPPEDLVKLTSLSGRALFYKDRYSLKHKVLALEEGDGAQEAMYAIRNLISAGELVSESTIKDLATGRLTTMENRVEGPSSVCFTTTKPDVDPETKSRFWVTSIDESRDQTRKILAFQRQLHESDGQIISPEIEAVLRKHRNFQRLLKPVAVKNPFAAQLAYGDDRLQGRRDQPKYLNLIKPTDLSFSRRDIREFTGWTNTRLHIHLKELVDFEYVIIETGRNGLPFRYRLAWDGQGKDGKRFMLGLTDPEKL